MSSNKGRAEVKLGLPDNKHGGLEFLWDSLSCSSASPCLWTSDSTLWFFAYS